MWQVLFTKRVVFELLLNNGIDKNHIIYLALDDLKNNHLLNPLSLDAYIRQIIHDDKT